MDDSDRDVQDAQAKPPRRRRRWIWIVAGVVVLFLGLGWFWWNQSSKWDERINAEIERYRAAGQPIYLADFDPPDTDDDDNAALALQEAVRALKLTKDEEILVEELRPEKVAENLDELRRIAEANSKVLTLVHRARSMKGADWGFRVRSPAVTFTLPPDLSEQRSLARFLRGMAIYFHKTGDEAAAVRTLHDTLNIGKTVRKMPLLICHLSALANDAIACAAVEDISADLKVAPPGGAGRKDVEAFIAELLDEVTLRKDTQRVYYGERAYVFDSAKLWIDGRMSLTSPGAPAALEAITASVLRPLHKKDLIGLLRMCTAMAEAAGQESWPEAKKLLPEEPSYEGFWDSATHTLSSILRPSLQKALMTHFRVIAMRRMAATALAIKLYETDHGSRPAELADLVPKYLPAVPKDPFAADGRDIGYLPNAPRPILYSVGQNGIDQGGKYADDPEKPPRFGKFDDPFFLNADRPRKRAPSTQPGFSGGP